jgi:fructokinase
MSTAVWVLGEALMDCVAQSDGSLRPLMGGSPFNMARATALRGASVGYLNPLSTDNFGEQMAVTASVRCCPQAACQPRWLSFN